MVVLKKLIFNSFYIGGCAVVLKELIFNIDDTLGGYDGHLEKKLIFSSFHFGRVWWS